MKFSLLLLLIMFALTACQNKNAQIHVQSIPQTFIDKATENIKTRLRDPFDFKFDSVQIVDTLSLRDLNSVPDSVDLTQASVMNMIVVRYVYHIPSSGESRSYFFAVDSTFKIRRANNSMFHDESGNF